ncbi:IS200/IS605 family element transposase accessory protein TnpB [Nonomuraea phyllanthi]|uniref:IS200/IS605 family element transposase accessory protein TnpB n=1 Tax=Nonomuraea phyllanthi TaxID=2219224 RepID=A0A5C4WVM6_9ACTN|nr:RNA-guided endonuclease TnpB family protein [Nonomuraea phyllanthi]KAB8197644.1 IS200/IS605 family element transposase accessory protein TnpB [Nonomuraea phyllanthi]
MQLRYSYRLDPTPAQRIALAKAFGCARVVFNDAVALRNHAHTHALPFITDAELSRSVITEAKKRPDRAWLAEVSAVVLQQALADATTAFRNFFSSVTGKRRGPKLGSPRFRSRKDNRQAIRFTRNARFKVVSGGMLALPKIGDVAVRWSRELPATPSSVTVIKDAAGRYFASFVVEVTDNPLPDTDTDTEAGIDLGLGHFAVLSDGTKVSSPRFLRRAEKRLKKLQRGLSRKEKGSKNRTKARIGVAAQHAKVADARREFHHQLSTKIIRENQAVYVEDLAVKGLARTRLAKSVHDAGWSSFVGMLEYKAKLYGRTFHRISRWFPSSKLCSACGTIQQSMPLNVREWTCACGATHDRDVNAAINILAAGRAERLNACGGPVRPPLVVAQPDEAGSHGSAAA